MVFGSLGVSICMWNGEVGGGGSDRGGCTDVDVDVCDSTEIEEALDTFTSFSLM